MSDLDECESILLANRGQLDQQKPSQERGVYPRQQQNLQAALQGNLSSPMSIDSKNTA